MAEYYGNGKSNLRWKLAMLSLWLTHPVWRWKYRKLPSSLNMISRHPTGRVPWNAE